MRERPRFPSRLVSGRGLLYHPRQARPARRSSVAILPSLGSEYFNGLLSAAAAARRMRSSLRDNRWAEGSDPVRIGKPRMAGREILIRLVALRLRAFARDFFLRVVCRRAAGSARAWPVHRGRRCLVALAAVKSRASQLPSGLTLAFFAVPGAARTPKIMH